MSEWGLGSHPWAVLWVGFCLRWWESRFDHFRINVDPAKDWDELTEIKSFLLFNEAVGRHSGSLFGCLATSLLWLIASIVPAATSICSCWRSKYFSQSLVKTWHSIKAASSFVNTWHQLKSLILFSRNLFTQLNTLPILFLFSTSF